MKLSLPSDNLLNYTLKQLEYFYPDGKTIDSKSLRPSLDITLDRIHNCFSSVRSPRYFTENNSRLDHLYSDHYIVYLWYFANTLWKNGFDSNILNKLYYLNKSLHSFDCLYNTCLPERFLIIHGVGTVLGKGTYGEYFVAHHGCTVGVHNDSYPVIGERVALAASSAVIGDSRIGDGVSVGSSTSVFNKTIPSGHSVYRDYEGKMTISKSSKRFADFYFI